MISFAGLIAAAQPYHNSWINYSQQYYKFQVAQTGIIRIDSTALANAGIPISSIDPRNLQLFARGVEQPIYIEGEGDGVFDGSDFIEFFGQYNDGWNDLDFYGSSANHPNPYYSIINDTIHYFITWNSSTSNNRLTLETDTSFSSYTPIDFFQKERLAYYSTNYFDGETDGQGATRFGYVLSLIHI